MRTVAAPALATFLIGLVSCAKSPPAVPSAHADEGATANPAPASIETPAGEALYAQYCALCHGDDRQGYAADDAPSLRSPELMGAASDSYLWQAISYGRPGTPMAAFAASQGGPLDRDAQRALFDWLLDRAEVARNPIPEAVVTGDVTAGNAIYATHCAACHGSEGEGITGTALANPVFLATASDAFIRHTVAVGRSGTPMGGFAGQLTEADVDNVVAFLRSRAQGWNAPAPVQVTPPDAAAAILNPDAPPAALEHRAGRYVSSASVAAALERQERLVLLDARPLSDWQRSHIPGALPVPFYDGVHAIVPHLPRDGTPIVAYCACPHAASGQVVDALRARGFEAARILDEGVLHWSAEGYPVQAGAAP